MRNVVGLICCIMTCLCDECKYCHMIEAVPVSIYHFASLARLSRIRDTEGGMINCTTVPKVFSDSQHTPPIFLKELSHVNQPSAVDLRFKP